MRRFGALLMLMTLSAGAGAGDLVVKVEGVKNGKGMVRGLLFTKAEGFPDGVQKALAKAEVKAKEGAVTLTFKDVEVNAGAISVIHDEDNDQKLKKNLIGVPKEGVGASGWNGSGKPKFARCEIKWEEGKVVRIRVRYF